MRKIRAIKRVLLLILVVLLLYTGYHIYFVSPNDYTFSTYDYVNKDISSQLNHFKIAYISDINLTDKESVTRFQEMITELNQKPFDMLILGGDLYDSAITNTKDVSKALKSIQCKYGKFAVLGEKDKDNALEVTQVFNQGGVEVLENTSRTIYYKDTSFLLIANQQDADIQRLKNDTQTIRIGVTHQPDTFTQQKNSLDLQLSGHSYGGSFYLPFYGALFTTDGAKTYNHGLYEDGKSALLVSNGFHGPSSFPYKFLATNEVNFIILKSSRNS